ncbi:MULTISPECIES: sugar transferase [Sphingobium]|uniref:Lipopolysaccharide/colanic/teichoic acid biosynthesis glycosyltransferase n=1 Tax=Sphingobium wenxiniae (strain DSM 21828 / CGMCC 1.7748 / JZ-1) TaxID=595605 RepID=A0A562K2H6_SPHWJ|nr:MULTISPECIES: sugar transferase [Sphingobium]TWH89443.1 lipopolysaccharide/colanic/teichoic acid biosynthesis glycosyltransferase [Sphingobium wenxiniae]WRD75398.1 sugar transferase [Sphingobium baderi]
MGRGVTCVLAFAALAAMALPMALIGLLVLLFLGRPVLFRQARAGLGGRPFDLVKFRTMHDACDASGQALPDHARTPAMGRLLRRSRLDELPELWNILRGDMALVGPRPLLPDTIAALGTAGLLRSSVRPGITGLAQVSGNTLLAIEEKLALDLHYVREWSVALDLWIMVQTPLMMIRGERIDSGLLEKAHAGGHRRQR